MADEVRLDDRLGSKIDLLVGKARENHAALAVLMAELRNEEDEIRLGGGGKAAEAQRAKGRLTVRERLALLLDEGTELLELGLWAAFGMYQEYGGAPGAGEWAALHDHCERRYGEGWGVLSDDREEGFAGATDCFGESDSYALFGGFFGCVSAVAGRCVSGYG